MSARCLRVLSLNLWNDQGDVSRRMDAALAALRPLEVDVIGLQEVREGQAVRQAEAFARALSGRAIFTAADPHSAAGAVGNAIVSRLPMRELDSVRLPAPPRDPRVATAVELDTAAGPVVFVNTHLSWELEASPVRERQVVALDDFCRPFRRALPQILTGDFNAPPDADCIRFLTGRKSLDGRGTYWRDAWQRVHPHDDGYTWSAHNPQVTRHVERNRHIDFVFVGPLAEDGRGAIVDARLALDQPGKDGMYPSDHFGVLVEIALDPVEAPR